MPQEAHELRCELASDSRPSWFYPLFNILPLTFGGTTVFKGLLKPLPEKGSRPFCSPFPENLKNVILSQKKTKRLREALESFGD